MDHKTRLKLPDIPCRLIAGMTFLITAGLAAACSAEHMQTDFETMTEVTTFRFTNPICMLAFAAALAVLFYAAVLLIFRGASGSDKRYRMTISFTVLGIAELALAYLWLKDFPSGAYADQQIIWDSAEKIVKGTLEQKNLHYFRLYPQQRSMTLFMALLIRIGGNSPDTLFRPLSAVAAALLVPFAGDLAYRISGREESGVLTSLLTVTFFPLVIYTAFVYGTLLSLAFAMICFLSVIRLLQIGKPVWLIPEGISAAMMYFFYTGTMIAGIAVLITLALAALAFIRSSRRRAAILVIGAVLPLCLMAGTWKMTSALFERETGLPAETCGLPVESWVQMGISSDGGVCGPGSYRRKDSCISWYEDHDCDTTLTRQEARRRILHIVEEYRDGTRSPEFFVEKTAHQWTDPWFSSLTLTVHSGKQEVLSKKWLLVHPKVLLVAEWTLAALLLLVYAGSATFSFLSFRMRSGREKFAEEMLPRFLLMIYFIGGFVFQLFWESKARYCLPYFTILIPCAADSLLRIFKWAERYKTEYFNLPELSI